MFKMGNNTQSPVEIPKANLLFFTIQANGISPTICKKVIRPSISPPKTINAIIIFQKDSDITQLKGKRIATYIMPVYSGVYIRAANT